MIWGWGAASTRRHFLTPRLCNATQGGSRTPWGSGRQWAHRSPQVPQHVRTGSEGLAVVAQAGQQPPQLPSEMGAPRDGKAPTNLSPPPRGKGTCLGCEGGNWLPSTHPLSQPPAKPCMAGGELQQGL